MGPDLGNDVAMARTIWKGALSFGLVNVPVGLYPGHPGQGHPLQPVRGGTSDRIRYKKVNERTGKEVRAGKIVKGFDLGGGEYVILTDDELAAAEPERSQLIEITDFVDLDEIDPIFYRSTYYLAPEGEAASKAYALLRQVMRERNKVAIGTARDAEQGVSGRDPSRRRGAETRDHVLRRRDPVTDQGAARPSRCRSS